MRHFYPISDNECSIYEWNSSLANMLRMTIFNLFGELFFDFFDEEEHKPWTCDPATMRDGGSLCQDYVCFFDFLKF